MSHENDPTVDDLQVKNKTYQSDFLDVFGYHVKGQSPKIAVLTCADSRVIPEYIFHTTLGELFVVRVAGNIAVGETVLASLEYAVDHLQISHLLVLGHTHCGAVKAAEEAPDSSSLLIKEIRDSFHLNENNHVLANLTHQLTMLPKRSTIIENAIQKGTLKLIGGIYHLEDGHVEIMD